MGQAIDLRCRCGQVDGTVSNASPQTVTRVLCYCDDCQAFVKLHSALLADGITRPGPQAYRFAATGVDVRE